MIQFIPSFINDYLEMPLNQQIAAMLAYYLGPQTCVRTFEFKDDDEMVFTSDKTKIMSNKVSVRVEQLLDDGRYVTRNDNIYIGVDGTISVDCVKPFNGRLVIIDEQKLLEVK